MLAALLLLLASADARIPPSEALAPGFAYGELCFWLRTNRTCPEPWTTDGIGCLHEALEVEATRRGVSERLVISWAIDHCEDPKILSKFFDVPLGALGEARRGCPTTPETWLALYVREDMHRVPYWLLWHMALGVSKFLIYDNDDLHLRHDSLDDAQLRTVLDAFIREGYVKLVPFSGPNHEGGQFHAYHNAVGRAKAGGAVFVGAMDTDEFLIPFADTCATTLLRRCLEVADCGAVQTSWRMASYTGVEATGPSFWRSLKRDVGVPDEHTKTFALVNASHDFNNSHYNYLKPHYRHYRDDARTALEAESPYARPPAYADQRAVVYHAHKTDFLSWVRRKSLRGRASQVIRAPGGLAGGVRDRKCPTCFSGLLPMAAEYDWGEGRAPISPTTANEQAMFGFVKSMDNFMEEYLAAW